jgi:hypothetical protein
MGVCDVVKDFFFFFEVLGLNPGPPALPFEPHSQTFCLYFEFEMGLNNFAQAGLVFTILLPQPVEKLGL